MSTDPNIEDDFGKFFDQLSELGGKPAPASFGAENPEPPTEPVAEPAPEPPKDGEGGAVVTPEPEPVVAVETPPAPEPPKPAPSQDDAIARLADMLAQRQPPAPAPQPAPEPRVYTDDDVKVLSEFEKDYPDIAKALQLVLKGVVTTNNAQIMQQIAQVVQPQMESLQTVQVNQQLTALRQAIPDYDQVRDPVIEWVNTAKDVPAYLRAARQHVIEQGDVTDIAHLVGEWRQATGKSAPPAPAAPAAKKANELSEAAKQAAESLAPVVSKRTVTAPSTPTSYEDAFEAAAAAMARA